jgi:HD superfamily phosphohydrolase
MYWQVYLHKTVLAAEHLLILILKRARELTLNGQEVFATPSLLYFLREYCDKKAFDSDPAVIERFALLDDFDIFTSVKVWCAHPDRILSMLCHKMTDRQLFRIIIQNEPFADELVEKLKDKTARELKLKPADTGYFVFTGEIANNAYNPAVDRIQILHRDGTTLDITESSDQLNVSVLSKTIKKFFLCYPKEIRV